MINCLYKRIAGGVRRRGGIVPLVAAGALMLAAGLVWGERPEEPEAVPIRAGPRTSRVSWTISQNRSRRI